MINYWSLKEAVFFNHWINRMPIKKISVLMLSILEYIINHKHLILLNLDKNDYDMIPLMINK